MLHISRIYMKYNYSHITYIEWMLTQGREYYTDEYIYKIIMRNKGVLKDNEVVEFLLAYNTSVSKRIIRYVNDMNIVDRDNERVVDLYRKHFLVTCI